MYEISRCSNVAPTFYEVGSLVHFYIRRVMMYAIVFPSVIMIFNGRSLRI
jgi:hypothetical protein